MGSHLFLFPAVYIPGMFRSVSAHKAAGAVAENMGENPLGFYLVWVKHLQTHSAGGTTAFFWSLFVISDLRQAYDKLTV